MAEVISTGCPHDCGGNCVLKVHVKDGQITRVTTVADPELKACVRGLYYHERFSSPDRLKYPLKRTGEKGDGKFERVSWDEALDAIATRMKQIKNTHGNSAFLLNTLGGELGQLYGTYFGPGERLFNLFGGCVELWSVTSFEGLAFASRHTLGSGKGFWKFPVDANERDDLLNSRLIILWGCNPRDTIQGTGTFHYLSRAGKAGINIICIDPIHTETAKSLNAPWIPIRPGTDAAMLAAMAYVIITENLHDRAYLDKYTTGFDLFKDYILGRSDGTTKTPQWAEVITGVPASSIIDIARSYATTKPAALIQGYAPGRTSFGEQFHRMAITLEAMTGNIGKHGGSAG
ncbi:MAG: molybdopterin-dependent oxidoreductase, partial [Chloroflexi bacterium]|nr:molybdopterin-dependent oxidoreductase [Chloroflexota bacterium]